MAPSVPRTRPTARHARGGVRHIVERSGTSQRRRAPGRRAPGPPGPPGWRAAHAAELPPVPSPSLVADRPRCGRLSWLTGCPRCGCCRGSCLGAGGSYSARVLPSRIGRLSCRGACGRVGDWAPRAQCMEIYPHHGVESNLSSMSRMPDGVGSNLGPGGRGGHLVRTARGACGGRHAGPVDAGNGFRADIACSRDPSTRAAAWRYPMRGGRRRACGTTGHPAASRSSEHVRPPRG